jgi:hypothetical protein
MMPLGIDVELAIKPYRDVMSLLTDLEVLMSKLERVMNSTTFDQFKRDAAYNAWRTVVRIRRSIQNGEVSNDLFSVAKVCGYEEK